MKNREAARYARWAAITAGLIALGVAGVYARRAFHEAQARAHAPKPVPAAVQQQSAEFKFSKVEQEKTIFTVRASHLTQFKDQDRSVLQDVWITIYGREGNRNDNIHTRECSYEPKSGAIRCEGDVQIDIQGTGGTPGKPGGDSSKLSSPALEVKTRSLSFQRESGEASTTEPVDFTFPGGHGRGVGVIYSTEASTVRLQRAVELEFWPDQREKGLPIQATCSSAEVRRDDHVMVLHGAAKVRQGGRELTAGQISIDLDEEFRAQRVVAEDHPAVHAAEPSGQIAMTADQIETFLTPARAVERIVVQGHVEGIRESATGKDHFSTARAEFTMQAAGDLIKEMTATGGVALDSQQGVNTRSLKTDSLVVKFGHGARAAQQQVESAETLAPGTIESKNGDDSTILRAKKFVAQFGNNGRMEKLQGRSGAEVRRQTGVAAPQVITAAELAATFDAKGEWDTFDESGNVHFQQADKQASAAHGRMIRATDTITLDGSPVLSDAVSRTTVAGNVNINQKSGEVQTSGAVVSTYLASGHGGSTVNMGSGPAHISADSLTGSTATGHAIYSGHARLWQDQSLLNADQIEVWREEKKLEAKGRVVAVFPQATGQPGPTLGPAPRKSTALAVGASSANLPGASSGPVLWEIHAPLLTYWSDLGKAHLEGGVTAASQQGGMTSRSLDVFLSPTGPATGAPATSSAPASASTRGLAVPEGGRQLSRALALGNVVVRQGDRRGVAEQGEYLAADGKFVLSGGQPTITDASSDTTTGHSLTFFVANDTILIDSQEGSRTLTKHRVEK
ncbi:MAG TPA: LPS export ABC transporter periplasmic protein LptC [Candidatus Limnocylindria bacterium]|nr:LPS export ABC transporter periplasmic protein LptC [Candidatus Limnocylindria bacterium]